MNIAADAIGFPAFFSIATPRDTAHLASTRRAAPKLTSAHLSSALRNASFVHFLAATPRVSAQLSATQLISRPRNVRLFISRRTSAQRSATLRSAPRLASPRLLSTLCFYYIFTVSPPRCASRRVSAPLRASRRYSPSLPFPNASRRSATRLAATHLNAPQRLSHMEI
jgi:hypothetical protein